MSQPPQEFCLRPWPVRDQRPQNLGEFIARMNKERGGLRHVTAAQLEEEIKAEAEGRVEEDGDHDSGEDAEDTAAKNMNLMAAREDFIRNINLSYYHAVSGRDLVSLLLSKENPNTAVSTLTPDLREKVGIGTLGAVKLKESRLTDDRIKEMNMICYGWRVSAIDEMIKKVTDAANDLNNQMELEAKYWNDVLAVRESGWQVFELPQDPKTLAIRYGPAECSVAFKDRGVASLERDDDDGSVRLEFGNTSLGSTSKRLCVSLRDGDRVLETSKLPARPKDDAPLQTRVLEARNTIFAQELWHELHREANDLMEYGVRDSASEITLETSDKKTMVLTLKDLEDYEEDQEDPGETKAQEMVDLTATMLELLLIHTHRLNYNTRTQSLQPASRSAQPHPVYNMLRPWMSRSNFYAASDTLTKFVSDLTASLRQAGITESSFVKQPRPIVSQIPLQPALRTPKAPCSEVLTFRMFNNIELMIHLDITSEARMMILGRSLIRPVITTQFLVRLPPDKQPASVQEKPDPQRQQTASRNPLEWLYPPDGPEPYPDHEALMEYIRQATIRGVAAKMALIASQRLGRNDLVCGYSLHGFEITNYNRQVLISVSGAAIRLVGRTRAAVTGHNICSVEWDSSSGTHVEDSMEEIVVNMFR